MQKVDFPLEFPLKCAWILSLPEVFCIFQKFLQKKLHVLITFYHIDLLDAIFEIELRNRKMYISPLELTSNINKNLIKQFRNQDFNNFKLSLTLNPFSFLMFLGG